MAAFDCFISYSSHHERMASAVGTDLRAHGLSVFLASISLPPGERWSPAIRKALNSSDWIIFLAGKEARESPWVQQELGMAIQADKRVVPVIWDCAPSELPGWIKEFQAIDLRSMTPEQMHARIIRLGGVIRTQKERSKAGWIVASLVGIALFGASGESDEDSEADEDDEDDDYDK